MHGMGVGPPWRREPHLHTDVFPLQVCAFSSACSPGKLQQYDPDWVTCGRGMAFSKKRQAGIGEESRYQGFPSDNGQCRKQPHPPCPRIPVNERK